MASCEKCIKTVCCECEATMCKHIKCDCFSKCNKCGEEVNLKEYGWACSRCNQWLCDDCKTCDCHDESDTESDYSEENECEECKKEEYTCHGCQRTGCNECLQDVCCDCCVLMCEQCREDYDVRCGCYGECTDCGVDVDRGENGWPCDECGKWLCHDCKKNSDCKECGYNSEDDNN
jgi:hypothetical protein